MAAVRTPQVPDDSSTSVQDRADAKTDWRTYPSATRGVPYYYNIVTRASVWTMPAEVAAALEQVDAEDAATPRATGAEMVRAHFGHGAIVC